MSSIETQPDETPSHQPFVSHLETTEGQPLDAAGQRTAWLTFSLLLIALVACYWNMLVFTSTYWSKALYSHGWIVPVFAGYLFVVRSGVGHAVSMQAFSKVAAGVVACVGFHAIGLATKTEIPSWFILLEICFLLGIFLFCLRGATIRQVMPGERWIGLAILAVSLGVRLFASHVDSNPLDRLTFLGALIGICQLMGGFSMLRWAGPPLGFLFFMFPMPSVIERTVLLELQKGAAMVSTWTVQILGLPAIREGSRIVIDQIPLDVADACSGLRMSTIFGAMAVAMVLLIDRPWWDRLIILISAIPIALLTNIIRITVTALLYYWFPENERLHLLAHDWAGYVMMPIALGFLWLELQILTRLTIPLETDDYAGFGATAHA